MEDATKVLHKLVLEDSPPVDQLTDCFRSLRNNCASSSIVQSDLGHESVLSDANSAIAMGLSTSGNDDWDLCLRIIAQFLGNLIVNNPKNQEIVWTQSYSQLKKMAQHGDTKLTNICLMVLYNILLGCPNFSKDFVNDEDLLKQIFKSAGDGLEFAQFIVEHLLTQDVDWSKIYSSHVPVNGRFFVLDLVEAQLKKSPDDVPVNLVSHLAQRFCKQSDCILRTVADKIDSLEPDEVATLLQLLASCSAHSPHLQTLQKDKNFFINSAFLLKSIHLAGKEQENCFSAVPKLSAADEGLQCHPAFGFKANLIRVLGNLCWQHKDNQDMMRELEVIPLLLDCCNIDARNPFIIQWVVLAVRNLCENNKENQTVIGNMTREGLVESSVLTELGLTLHSDQDNNQLLIAPLNSVSKK